MDLEALPPPEVLRALADVGRYSVSAQAWRSVPNWAPAYLKARGVACPPPPSLDLGYLPAGKTEELVPDIHLAIESGLAQPAPSGVFYHYDGRLVSGIRDFAGRLRGFYGRSMPGLEDVAKWVAPGSSHFQRRGRFAGWPAEWPSPPPHHVLAVEGPLDAAAIHDAQMQCQHRFLLALATCGSPNLQHVGLVRGLQAAWRCRVWLVYDGDEGGRQAAAQWVEYSVRLRCPKPVIVELPEGEDPASFVAGHGITKLIGKMQEAARRGTKTAHAPTSQNP